MKHGAGLVTTELSHLPGRTSSTGLSSRIHGPRTDVAVANPMRIVAYDAFVTADPARAADLLGFRARTSFADGIAAFATDPLRDAVG